MLSTFYIRIIIFFKPCILKKNKSVFKALQLINRYCYSSFVCFKNIFHYLPPFCQSTEPPKELSALYICMCACMVRAFVSSMVHVRVYDPSLSDNSHFFAFREYLHRRFMYILLIATKPVP